MTVTELTCSAPPRRDVCVAALTQGRRTRFLTGPFEPDPLPMPAFFEHSPGGRGSLANQNGQPDVIRTHLERAQTAVLTGAQEKQASRPGPKVAAALCAQTNDDPHDRR